MSEHTNIENLLNANEIYKAIDELISFAHPDSTEFQDLIKIKSRYNRYLKMATTGLIGSVEAQSEMNQIKLSIIDVSRTFILLSEIWKNNFPIKSNRNLGDAPDEIYSKF